ncbi:MAG TPA: PKD domain-containing protein [Chitinophagales bacterium]|nr:PKD domain-containing protein [Chitinophagales bacterium]
MKKFITTLSFSFIITFTFAQKQTWQWYFGYNTSMEFSTGAPVVTNNSAMSMWEGSASIADANGDLLFYTDGLSAWNQNHTVMPNSTGMLGNYSSNQSAIIVQKPGSSSIYYIFVTSGTDAHYSEVDMTLQGGLGDVTATKNVLISSSSCEELAAVRHANGQDIWVAIHELGNTVFDAFLVTSSGVNLTPVSSSVGNYYWGNGQLQFSPNGKHAAVGNFNGGETVELYDFDHSTGVFSNHIGLVTSYSQTYGLEFSPNSKILYTGSNPVNEIHQWDISLWDSATIAASNTIVGYDSYTVGSLQLAPDGKLYIAHENASNIGVVNFPDSLGLACDFVSFGVDLTPKYMGLGLPNFLASYFAMLTTENTCFGDSTYFYLSGGDDSLVQWNFGDPASGAANTDSGMNVYHVFTAIDMYTVTIIEYFTGGNIDTTYSTLVIAGLPVIYLGNDTTVCFGDSLILDAGNPGASYSWSNGMNTQTIAVTDSGMYKVSVSNSGCMNTDSINVSFIDCALFPQPGVFVDDPTICEKFCLNFHDESTNNPTSWYWQFPDASPSISTQQDPTNICYNTPGTFDVILTVTNVYGSLTQTFPNFVTVYPTPPAPVINQVGYTLTSSAAPSYQWQFNLVDIPGATNQSYTVTQSGYYTVIVSDANGCVNSTTQYVLISGVDDGVSDANVSVYPNPSSGTFMVEWLNGLMAGEVSIDVLNTLGQKVFSSSESRSTWTAHYKKEMDLSNIARGIYFIEIKTKYEFWRKKILIAE